jgi:site-specific DNA recombinase
MTKRAVLYARVSDDDRRYATSGIQQQLDDCRAYAARQGYQVVGEYFEDPNRLTSGADWLPGIEQVLELAERGGFDVLIARELDRLARDRVKHIMIRHQLELAGVSVEYVIGGDFSQSDEGQLTGGHSKRAWLTTSGRSLRGVFTSGHHVTA